MFNDSYPGMEAPVAVLQALRKERAAILDEAKSALDEMLLIRCSDGWYSERVGRIVEQHQAALAEIDRVIQAAEGA